MQADASGRRQAPFIPLNRGGHLEDIWVYGFTLTQGVRVAGPQPPEAEIFKISMFRTLWNALEKLKFKEIYQLKVPIFTLKILKIKI